MIAAVQKRAGKPLLLALTAVIVASALIGGVHRGHVMGQLFTGILSAAAFWFGANRVLDWVMAAKRGDDAPVPLITAEEDPALAPVLAKLEAARIEMAGEIERRLRLRLPLGLAAGIAAWAATQFSPDPGGLIEIALFCFFGAGFGYFLAAAALSQRYSQLYKHEVLPPLAARFGDLDYRAAIPPDAATLRQQRLFVRFDTLSADDEIFGTYRGVPISIIELRLTEKDDNNTKVIFDGLFTRITLPRTLSGTTAVIADNGVLGSLRDVMRADRVHLEDPNFEKVYQVFGTEQIAARALLTPAFMERFLKLGERTGFRRPVALAQGNDLTIALPKQGYNDLFEPPSYNKRAASREALVKLHDDIAAVLTVADSVIDLDHSVRGAFATEVAGAAPREARATAFDSSI